LPQHLHHKSQNEKHRSSGLYQFKLDTKDEQSLAKLRTIAAIRSLLKIQDDLSVLTQTRG
jgi:hypothetical protein